MTVISLLRGINLGGNKKVPMSDLRALYETLGFSGSRTHIQSGNIVGKVPRQDLRKLKAKIEAGIKDKFGFHSEVALRTLPEWNEVIAANPFPHEAKDAPSKLLVAFLPADPGHEARNALMAIDASPEQLHTTRREIYIYYPNGVGLAKLKWSQIDKLIRTPGTGRNWNTVLKLRALAEEVEAA